MIKVLSSSIRVLSTTAHQVKITIKTKKVEKHAEITFESVGTNYGFKHQGEIWANVQPIEDDGSKDYNKYESIYKNAKCIYYNRTWENYNFQSLIINLLEKSKMFTEKEIQKIDNNLKASRSF